MSIRPAFRRPAALLLLSALVLSPFGAIGQQPAPGGTLAERLAALRGSWGEDSQPAEPAPAPRRVSQPASPGPNNRTATEPRRLAPVGRPAVADRPLATPLGAGAPKVDPRGLVPRNWFGSDPDTIATDAGVPAAERAAATRNRLQRDLQGQVSGGGLATGGARGEALATDSGDSRPAPRAGSAFTAAGPSLGAPAATPKSASAALRRSIAADVARSMGTQADLAPTAVVADSTKEAVVEVAPIGAQASGSQAKLRTRGSSQSTMPPLVIGDAPRANAPKSTFDGAKSETVNVQATARAATRLAASADNLLLSQRTPMVVSRVQGPATITVGREAPYRVEIANRGDAPADHLVTRIAIPAWSEVVAASTATGAVEKPEVLGQAGEVVWRIDSLAAGSGASLELKLVARAGKPIDLAVSCKHDAPGAKATVEVQEPKLSLDLSGPDEVLFGKPQPFRLTITNPGTGAAEGVSLKLTPPGKDASRGVTHSLGSLAAGESRSVEVELTAREAGKLDVVASATALGDLSAESTKQIFCRKAELAVDWRGPQQRYAGAPAVYYFRVRNPGTAVAPDVTLSIQLPEGFRLEPLADTPTPVAGRLVYRVGSMRPGDDRYFEVRGALDRAGANSIPFQAIASDETRSGEATATTEVVAVADLKLDIIDPTGPMAVGSDVTYQVRVVNRGASVAREVKVVGLFSEGIEPVGADGESPSIKDGRVAFATIDSLPAGGEKVYTIHAKAKLPGAHLFRAEVLCRDLEIKLAAEETTRFFADEAIDMASVTGSAGY